MNKNVRTATPADRPHLIKLWQRVFGDDEAFINACLDTFAGDGNVFVYTEGDKSVAMHLAVPCTLANHKGYYHYALATHPAHRGKGIMSRLMRHVEIEEQQRGASFALLIPASESLFGYYEKRGYRTFSMRYLALNKSDLTPQAGASAQYNTQPFSAQQFQTLRHLFADTAYTDFSVDRYEMILTAAYEDGWQCLQSAHGYALYQARGETLAVAELFARDDKAATALISHLFALTGTAQLTATLPTQGGVFAGQGTAGKAAQIIPYTQEIQTVRPYLRFAIDDVFDKDYETI